MIKWIALSILSFSFTLSKCREASGPVEIGVSRIDITRSPCSADGYGNRTNVLTASNKAGASAGARSKGKPTMVWQHWTS
jgi:hypothetical protein